MSGFISTMPSLLYVPNTNTSDIKSAICLGGKLTTAKICFPIKSSILYISVICAEDFFIPISYSLGYATGTLLGAFLSKALIKGVIGIQIITDQDKKEIINALKIRGYSFNILNIESGFNSSPKIMIFLEVNKKSLKKVQNLIKKNDPDAFIAISDTKTVYNGTIK